MLKKNLQKIKKPDKCKKKVARNLGYICKECDIDEAVVKVNE